MARMRLPSQDKNPVRRAAWIMAPFDGFKRRAPLTLQQVRFLRQYEPQYSVAVKEARSERFVRDLVQYMLVSYFPNDPVFFVADPDLRRWFIDQLVKVRWLKFSRNVSHSQCQDGLRILRWEAWFVSRGTKKGWKTTQPETAGTMKKGVEVIEVD